MNWIEETIGTVNVLRPEGRLDAHGAAELSRRLAAADGADRVLVSMQSVSYASSAALRALVMAQKRAAAGSGRFALCSVGDYCREVLRISGLESALEIFPSESDALAAMDAAAPPVTTSRGSYRFSPGSDAPGGIAVLGHIEDVLASRITAAHLASKPFSSTEYSLGLGALGPTDAEVLPILGEMITVGGTMVWLPTDGNDTADYLVPKADSGIVQIRTGFNAALDGPFNEFVDFRASSPEGITLSELYRDLFDLAAQRRADYRGAIGLAMRCETAAMFGSGARMSPILENAPANGEWITHPDNFAEWFEIDHEPRCKNVTGLISGVGLDLRHDLSGFDSASLGATFYRNPGNAPELDCQLHNHGVFFSPLPFPDPPRSLEEEISAVVEQGDFIDMRHLLDRTRVTRALIGLIVVQTFHPDTSGLPTSARPDPGG